jgi:prevent-host-death family protein
MATKTGHSDAIEVTSEQLRLGLGELISRVKYGGERVLVTRRGKPVMALVSVEDLKLLEQVLDAIEDEIDAPIVRERLKRFDETGEAIPWEQVKAEYGL